MALEVVNLTEHVGAEIRGGKGAILDPGAAGILRRTLIERGVLVFKRLDLNDQEQLALAASLGEVRQERSGAITKITLDTSENVAADYLKGSFFWHLDGTHDAIPIFASLLSGRKLSDTGGQTEFASSYAAYDTLPQAMKDRIADLKAVHSVEVSMRRAGVEPTEQNLAIWRMNPDRSHNIVWTHEDGRKSLVIGLHASHVEGMDRAEGQKLLEELVIWATQPQFVYRHEWSVGDLLIWDNTGVLHRAEPYALDSGRMMHRTTLVGREAFA